MYLHAPTYMPTRASRLLFDPWCISCPVERPSEEPLTESYQFPPQSVLATDCIWLIYILVLIKHRAIFRATWARIGSAC